MRKSLPYNWRRPCLELLPGWRSSEVPWTVPRRRDMGCTPVILQQGRCNGKAYPEFVIFKDMSDPKTVEQVDPDNLGASLGKGYALKSISVQVTSEEITTGIEKRLRWLPQYYDKMLDDHRYNDSQSVANSLASGAFSANNGLSYDER